MQAIITKTIPASDRRGTRISATCAGGRIIVSHDDSLNMDENHERAARRLADKLEWNVDLVMGTLHTGDRVHVSMDRRDDARNEASATPDVEFFRASADEFVDTYVDGHQPATAKDVAGLLSDALACCDCDVDPSIGRGTAQLEITVGTGHTARSFRVDIERF